MRILGPLEVVRDGRVVRLGGRRPQAVLAVLAVHAGRVVPHEQLIEAAWDGRPPRTAPAVLRTYVAQLRAVIEPDVRSPDDARGAAGPDHWRVLLTQGPGYVLRTGAGQVDAERFGHLVEQGRRALAAGAHAEAADLLGEALALWRGPVLVGLAELEALGAYARRLDEDRWQAVEDRIEADLACGRHASLVGELQDLVEQEPLRERLCGQLMRALYRSGRQVSALSTYQALRERLADELGVDPAAELQRLHRAVLRHDPALAPPPAPGRARPAAAGGGGGGRGRGPAQTKPGP
ncbi:AfsR/SARP family transcriptional regulator, partial [Geodermatophilus sp. SYSU D00696]